VLALGSLAPAPSRAAETGAAWVGPSAFERAVRSAVFPAWGQLTNGKNHKAAVLFSVQAYLYTRIVREGREGGAAEREEARLEGMGADPAEIALARARATDHFDRRRNLLFWAFVAGFYGAIDAYIDAHLGDFERELEEGRTLFGRIDPADRSVELGLRF
jgi:hypothetical protein